jgi:hypothetical protein
MPFQSLQVERGELRELGDRHERQGLGVRRPPQPDVPRKPEGTPLGGKVTSRKGRIELDRRRHVIRDGNLTQRLIRLQI